MNNVILLSTVLCPSKNTTIPTEAQCNDSLTNPGGRWKLEFIHDNLLIVFQFIRAIKSVPSFD
jgi:hypothetical protein